MEYDHEFYRVHQIISLENLVLLKSERFLINDKINRKDVSQDKLCSHILSELNLLRKCKEKMTRGMKQDLVDLDTFDPQVISDLCIRVFGLFIHYYKLFTVDTEMIKMFIDFFQKHSNHLDVKQLKGLMEVVQDAEVDLHYWIKIIMLHIEKETFDNTFTIFKKVAELLIDDNRSLPLWNRFISHLEDKPKYILDKVYKEGSRVKYSNTAVEIRCKYLQWYFDWKGISKTRVLFKELKVLSPTSCKLYKVMIDIECKKKSSNLKIIRQLYNEAHQKFGKEDIGIWIDLIKYEHVHGDPKLVLKLYTTSLYCLNSRLTKAMTIAYEQFENQFKKKMNNIEDILVIDDD